MFLKDIASILPISHFLFVDRRLGVLNREIVSFRPCVRKRGLVA